MLLFFLSILPTISSDMYFVEREIYSLDSFALHSAANETNEEIADNIFKALPKYSYTFC